MSDKVLLIDDDPVLLSLMSSAFKAAGYTTFCAENGRRGLAMAEAHHPDLVVTDIVMPEMEGIGTILALRRSEQPPKVIAISGATTRGSRNYLKWARRLGANEVLAKPFRMSEILEVSRRVIASNTSEEIGS